MSFYLPESEQNQIFRFALERTAPLRDGEQGVDNATLWTAFSTWLDSESLPPLAYNRFRQGLNLFGYTLTHDQLWGLRLLDPEDAPLIPMIQPEQRRVSVQAQLETLRHGLFQAACTQLQSSNPGRSVRMVEAYLKIIEVSREEFPVILGEGEQGDLILPGMDPPENHRSLN